MTPKKRGLGKGLDALLGALRTGLGDTWARTTVLVATEFGRTAAANGTGGTDHGTGAVALLLGGRVQGGRVLADWPGLDTPALLDGRDLRPTLGLDALIARAAAESFGLDPERLGRQLFARGAVAQPLREPLLLLRELARLGPVKVCVDDSALPSLAEMVPRRAFRLKRV